jgi:sugar lactone lactonase YvrE
MSAIKLLKTLPVANILGEGVLWNVREQAFYWTDILGRKLYCYHPATDRLTWWDTYERLCSFGFIEDDGESLIAAFESGIAFYKPRTGEIEWLARPEAGITGTRFNDGRVDRQGRFWSGTMVEGKALDAHGRPATAGLYRVARGACAKMESGLRISNSLCWSLDSGRQYLADSPTHAIYVYDFDPTTGIPDRRRVFVKTESPVEPDGSCVDAEDHLWNAQWAGGKVVRYRPDGGIDTEMPLPVSRPSCVSFGGPGLNWLAVTSASVDLSESERRRQPAAGHLFIFETIYKGIPESLYIR